MHFIASISEFNYKGLSHILEMHGITFLNLKKEKLWLNNMGPGIWDERHGSELWTELWARVPCTLSP